MKQSWAKATVDWGNTLANLCLPFFLALWITIWDGSLYIIKCFPGILDNGTGCFSFGHGTSFVFHLHGLIQHGHSFFQQSLRAFFLLEQIIHFSFFSFTFACVFLLSPFLLDLSFPLLPFFISCMGWADAVSYILGEGQPVRFTTIPGYIGWNSTQAVDGWHPQPRSVACQQQLVLAKSSLYRINTSWYGFNNNQTGKACFEMSQKFLFVTKFYWPLKVDSKILWQNVTNFLKMSQNFRQASFVTECHHVTGNPFSEILNTCNS